MASFLLVVALCVLMCTSCLVNGAIIRQEGQDEPEKGLEAKSGTCITRAEYHRLMSLLEELRRHLNLDYLAAYAPEEYLSRIPQKRMDASEFLG